MRTTRNIIEIIDKLIERSLRFGAVSITITKSTQSKGDTLLFMGHRCEIVSEEMYGMGYQYILAVTTDQLKKIKKGEKRARNYFKEKKNEKIR